MTPFALALLALASYRVTRLLAIDDVPIVARPRDWFVRKVGGEDTTWGQFASCPFCLGVWCSIALLLLYLHGGRVGYWLIVGAAVMGAQALLSSWEGE